MNKTALLIVICVALSVSCSKKKENRAKPSIGKINSIAIVIDDQLWNGIIGDSLRNKFAAPVEGLSKEEPLFNINQYPIKVMEGFVTKNRTIIVIKKGSKNGFVIKENQYATPQKVIHITGKTLADLIAIIQQRSPQIIKMIQEGEIKAHQLLLNESTIDSKLLKDKFNIVVKISQKSIVALKNKNFIWLIKEFPSGSTNLLVTQLPLNSIKKEDLILEKIIKIHDSIGTLYVKGKKATSSQFVDRTYPLYFSKITIDGKTAYELKGMWRLKNSFMFGSFINYLIIDSKNNRILYIDGFCYIPSGAKRDCRHELEATIKGIQIN